MGTALLTRLHVFLRPFTDDVCSLRRNCAVAAVADAVTAVKFVLRTGITFPAPSGGGGGGGGSNYRWTTKQDWSADEERRSGLDTQMN